MGRVLVVGGGVIGLACAYELGRRGERVTVLDRGVAGGACSSGNAGWIVPSFSGPLPAPGMVRASFQGMFRPGRPLYIRPTAGGAFAAWLWNFWRHSNPRAYHAGLEAVAAFNANTMALFDALEADGVPFEMHREGLLFTFLTRAAADHWLDDLNRMRAYGYGGLTRLTGDEVRDLEPWVAREVTAGVLVGQERHVRPETLTAGLVKRLSDLAVEMHSGVAVTDFRRRAATVTAAVTPAGAVEADTFLIAAGVWSASLARRIGVRLPIQAGKGYSITVVNPVLRLRHAIQLGEAKIACSGFQGALRLAGTVEFSGMNGTLDSRRLHAMRRAADRYLVGWRHGERQIEWSGMRPMAPDGLPVIGRMPGCDNVFIATGHAMLGVTLAPATAVAVAELVCAGRTHLDLSAFDPSRFGRHRHAA